MIANDKAVSDFNRELAEKTRRYEQAIPRNAIDLALAGKQSEANSILESVVPDDAKTPVDYLILGNMLYAIDWEKSFYYHCRAYDACPGIVDTKLELAMQYQRRRESSKALSLYEALILNLDPRQDPLLATRVTVMLAHCYIDLGNYRKAVDAWGTLDFFKHRTFIDFVIHDVFGDRDPLARHSDLINQVATGRRDKIPELLALGLAWNKNWWTFEANERALAVDVNVIGGTFGTDSKEAEEARSVAEVASALAGDPEGVQTMRKLSSQLADGKLLSSTLAAQRIIAACINNKTLTSAEVTTLFAQELLNRVKSHDPQALGVLTYLYQENGNHDERAKLDLIGWREFHLADYTLSYILSLERKGKSVQEELNSAIAEFPDDSRIRYIVYKQAKSMRKEDLSKLMADVIKTEYFGLRNSPSRYASVLNAFYGELATLV